MPQLRIKSALEHGKVYDVVGELTKIGRDVACGITLNESGVSREHAEIYRVGEMFFIRDLGSRNGIMVNDQSVEDELLRDGDVIRICSYVMVFEAVTVESEGDQEGFDNEHNPDETMMMSFDSLESSDQDSDVTKAVQRMHQLAKETARLDNLLDGSLDIIFDMMKAQECFIFVLESGQRLAQKAYRKCDDSAKGKASRSIVLRALKDRATIVTSNAMDDFRFKAESSIFLKNVNSVLCCPITVLGQDVGVIYLNNSANFEAFSQDSAELVQQLAVPLGLAIQTLELRKSETLLVDKSTRLIAEIAEMAVPHLAGRAKRVAAMANVMGKVMGLKRPQLINLQVACFLHHVGYSEWSKKPDLSFEFLRDDLSYVERSVELLKRNDAYHDIRTVVATHRYRLDGKGTPAKLEPSTWSAEAQIISLCVELDSRLNLPMAFGREAQSIGEVAEFVSKEGNSLVTRPIVTIFEKAWKKGLIIA